MYFSFFLSFILLTLQYVSQYYPSLILKTLEKVKKDYHPQTTKGVCGNQSSKLSQANRMSNEQSTRDIYRGREKKKFLSQYIY